MSLKQQIRDWGNLILTLGKIRIGQMVTLSTATGYILASGAVEFGLFMPVSGIFVMALGSGALNQYQERRTDALMPRTCQRPIPSGRISGRTALLISMLLLVSGALILFIASNLTALMLAILTALWYNGVYTNLKKITPLAVIPGSLIGSLPPLVGWTSAGGYLFSPTSIALAAFFFMWQIPHFWLLLMKFGKDYEKIGYPSMTALLDNGQLGRLTFMWIVATAVALLVMPFFGLGTSPVIYFLLFLASVWLVGKSIGLLKPAGSNPSFFMAFRGINLFILVVMLLLSIDRIIYVG